MNKAEMGVYLRRHCGSDLDVVDAARASFGMEGALQEDGSLSEKDIGLIHYLAKNKHRSPFNHAFLSFKCKAPIFLTRQLVKHEYMPWNEMSRRYVDKEPEFWFPKEWRMRAENVKQGSSEEVFSGSFNFVTVDMDDEGDPYIKDLTSIEDITEDVCIQALDTYSALIDARVAPEQARIILPQNVMTEWVWSGTLGAFLKMITLRVDAHAQKEAQQFVQPILAEVKRLFPVSYEAIMKYGYA